MKKTLFSDSSSTSLNTMAIKSNKYCQEEYVWSILYYVTFYLVKFFGFYVFYQYLSKMICLGENK